MSFTNEHEARPFPAGWEGEGRQAVVVGPYAAWGRDVTNLLNTSFGIPEGPGDFQADSLLAALKSSPDVKRGITMVKSNELSSGSNASKMLLIAGDGASAQT